MIGRHFTGALLLAAALLSPVPAAQAGPEDAVADRVDPAILSEFAGVLPNGTFRFGVLISPDAPPEASLDGELPPGWVITFLQHKNKKRVMFTAAPEQITQLLTTSPTGEKMKLWLVNPQTGERIERWVVLRSREERLVEAQLAAAERDDLFGSSFQGERLRLMADGSFEALNHLLEQDAKTASASPFGTLLGLAVGNAAETLERLRYGGLIGMYGIARVNALGDCGEPMDGISTTVTSWTEFRNAFGRVSSSPVYTAPGQSFEVPRGFGAVIDRFDIVDVHPEDARILAEILGGMTCDSETRRALEDNMLAYWSNRPPVHVRE